MGAVAEGRRRRPAADPVSAQAALSATLACLLEVSAEKIGNVTLTQSFADARFEDFVSSALALGPAIGRATPSRVGRTVWDAVAATRRVTRTNTYLGVALLFAPIAAAWKSAGRRSLRHRLAEVLRDLDREDATWVYRAIRQVAPGGLGASREADVRTVPAVTLREAMALAADRDSIALEYVGDYGLTFDVALPALQKGLSRGRPILDAIVDAHLEIVAAVPDTLIARKAGAAVSRDVAARARRVVRAGGRATARGRAALGTLDRYLRSDGNRLNPGTSADLVAAALFVGLLSASVR